MNEKCYWCGKNATSREHVPPKSLFPENKDVKLITGKSYREGLITVPSCEEHNLAKSNDDEYLMICLGSKVGNNGIAYIHTNTKIRRALKRNPNIIEVVEENLLQIVDKEFPVLWVNIDTKRLYHSFEAIARAIFYYEFKTIYEGSCNIVSSIFLFQDNEELSKFQMKSDKALSQERKKWRSKTKGRNPEIFTYQISDMDGCGTFKIAFTFYEKTVVYVFMNMWEGLMDEKSKGLMAK